MPVGYGVDDHRLFVVDFATRSLVGADPPRIVLPAARRLTTKQAGCERRYNESLRANVIRHRLFEKMERIHRSKVSVREKKRRLDKLDRESEQYMKRAEKKCRKLKSGRIPFSPEAAVWIRRAQVYRSLMRYHAGKLSNRGNLKRAARRCNIDSPLAISVGELKARLDFCKEKCNFYRRHGHRFRRKHLQDRLEAAQEREDEEAEVKILAIIQREKDRSFWRRINFALGKHRQNLSVDVVQVEDGQGGVKEYDTQEGVQEAIWNEVHRKRFFLAEEAPICKGNLRGEFGYSAVSPTAKAVLAGTYEYPSDFDAPTRELCEEAARIVRSIIPQNSASFVITRELWQQKWRKAKEETSSSESGLHFGHYKAGANCDIILEFHAMKISLALNNGIALERWSRGLSVMLEKMFGVKLVSKLRAILLMEADFKQPTS